jgi:flagellar hook assembly protein FlgD
VVLPYAVIEPCRVRLEICDLLGRRVAVLLEEDKTAGQWSATWDGRDERGMISSSGLYIARLQITVRGKTELMTKKIMIQK